MSLMKSYISYQYNVQLTEHIISTVYFLHLSKNKLYINIYACKRIHVRVIWKLNLNKSYKLKFN